MERKNEKTKKTTEIKERRKELKNQEVRERKGVNINVKKKGH